MGCQEPTLWHRPDDAHASQVDDLLELADIAGLDLDPWQELCLREACHTRKPPRRNATPRWSATEVVVDVARQNGKGDVKLVRQLGGLFLFGEWLQVHTAHEFKTCYEHFRKMVDIIESTPDFTKMLKPRTGIRTGAGDQAVELKNGQRIRFIARSGRSGRGLTGDTVYLDEAFQLDADMVGALMPTLRARPNPQIWYTSSAAHADSDVLHTLRKRAVAGGEPRLLYLGWNNEPGTDPMDVDAWYRANPALGIRIDPEIMANEQRSMDADEFARECLGIPETYDLIGRVIAPALWEKVQSDDVSASARMFAVDVSDDRSDSSIAVAGDGVVGLADFGAGVGWVVDRVVELVGTSPVVVQSTGPAGTLIPDLERAGVRVVQFTPGDMALACSSFMDDLTDRRIAVRRHWKLDKAAAGATKRRAGDTWVWDRRDASVDVTPLIAATNALWAIKREPVGIELFVAVT